MRLPYAQEAIPLIMRAVVARHDSNRPPFTHPGEDLAAIAGTLSSYGYWAPDGVDGYVSPDILHRIGQHLDAALWSNTALRDWSRSFYTLAERERRGEICLVFDRAAQFLAPLPWEGTLRDGQPMLLAGTTVVNCVRLISLDGEVAQLLPPPQPWRVLHVAPRARMDAVGIAYADQAYTQTEAMCAQRGIVVESLRPATIRALHERLIAEPPITMIDFYGHGGRVGGQYGLLFDSIVGGGDGEFISAEQLRQLPRLPHVFLLHACYSGAAHASDPAAGIAAALSAAGVPAVIAMQTPVSVDSASLVVTPGVYYALINGDDAPTAVNQVRRQLYVERQQHAGWYAPVVYSHAPTAAQVRAVAPITRPNNPFQPGPEHDYQRIIGRETELAHILSHLHGGQNVSIIGPQGSGKTSLLHAITHHAPIQLSPSPTIMSITAVRDLHRRNVEQEIREQLQASTRTSLNYALRNRRVLIIIDDIGLLRADAQGRDVRQWLRQLTQNRMDGRMVQLLMSSVRPLPEVFSGDDPRDGSPLHDGVVMVELLPFSAQEIAIYVSQRLKSTGIVDHIFDDIVLGQAQLPRDVQRRCAARYEAQ